jgi:DNA-binding GntR family transcriptional regulator
MALLVRRPRVLLADDVAAELRERILRGDYPPGSRLHQERIAEELGLSRTPVREAMRTLEHEGLLVPDPNGGMRASARDPRMLLVAYELREAVDGLAARLAATAGEGPWWADLRLSLREQQSILDDDWDAAAWTRANARFHGLIIDATQNPYLRGLQHFVHNTSQVFRPMSVLGRERAEQALREHRNISQALTVGDAVEAERLARAHIRGTISALGAGLDDSTHLRDHEERCT